jgi:hypothetical protein
MTRVTPFLAALAFLAAAIPAAQAQDAGTDVFDASSFDQSVQQSAQAEQKAPIETQFGGNILYDTSATTAADFSGTAVGGSFTGKAFVKVSVPDYGSAYLAYNFSKNLYQGAAGTVPGTPLGYAGPALSIAAGDLYSASYALAELWAGFDIAQAIFFRVGNQLLAWGPSLIWTPVDFVNLQRVNPLGALDLRVGKPGIRITVPFGISNLFVFADMSGTVTPTGAGGALVVNDPLATTNLAARWDITLLGFELALTGYTGSSIQSRAGFDVSGRLFGFDVYGELAAGLPGGTYSSTWSTSVGAQRTLGELGYWSIAAELYYNSAGSTGADVSPSLVSSGTFSPFYTGAMYAYASITRTHLFMDGVSATLAGFVDISDLSFLTRLSTTMNLPGVPPFTFSLSWSGGGADKAFTYITGNNSISADLQIKLEF